MRNSVQISNSSMGKTAKAQPRRQLANGPTAKPGLWSMLSQRRETQRSHENVMCAWAGEGRLAV